MRIKSMVTLMAKPATPVSLSNRMSLKSPFWMAMRGSKLPTVEESAEKKSQESMLREKSQNSRRSRRSNSADDSPVYVTDVTSPLLGKYNKLGSKQHNNMRALDNNKFSDLFEPKPM